jgi:hypothetical protein
MRLLIPLQKTFMLFKHEISNFFPFFGWQACLAWFRIRTPYPDPLLTEESHKLFGVEKWIKLGARVPCDMIKIFVFRKINVSEPDWQRVCVGAGEGRHFRADQLSAAADGVPPAQLQQGHPHTHALVQGRLSPQVNILTFILVLYSTLLHLPPLRFLCFGGCWDRPQDCCNSGIGSQTL